MVDVGAAVLLSWAQRAATLAQRPAAARAAPAAAPPSPSKPRQPLGVASERNKGGLSKAGHERDDVPRRGKPPRGESRSRKVAASRAFEMDASDFPSLG